MSAGLGPLLPKPKYTTPCNHCGRCCTEELCPAAELAFPGSTAPCPAIKRDDGQILCGLVEVEMLAGLDGMVSRVLGIGCGCSMPDDDTTAEEIEAFDKHSHITVYGHNVKRSMSNQKTQTKPDGGASVSTAMLERCECGRGNMVTLPNGERHCSDTLRKFEIQNGRPYGVR